MSAKPQTTQPRERPILFSAPMVRAILDGRKTMTRRIVKPDAETTRPFAGHPGLPKDFRYAGVLEWRTEAEVGISREAGKFIARVKTAHGDGWTYGVRCPYGVPGDRLWVKETHAIVNGGAFYRADGPWPEAYGPEPKWRPSIHMPRWASRIDLEVTAVRVERLQEITPTDALAEGVDTKRRKCLIDRCEEHAVDAFRDLWDEINGERAAWADNPWCWVISFRRVRP